MRRATHRSSPARRLLTLLGAALLVVGTPLAAQAGWAADAPLTGATGTGSLAIDADTLDAGPWTRSGTTFDPATDRLRAGDTLTSTVDVSVTAVGENLEATFGDVSGAVLPAAVRDHVDVSVDAAPVLGSASGADGRQDVAVTLTVAADAGLPKGDHVVDLTALELTLATGSGWEDTATLDAGTLRTVTGPTAPGGTVTFVFDLTKSAGKTVALWLDDPAATITWGSEGTVTAVDGRNAHTFTGWEATSNWVSVKVTGTFDGLGSPAQTEDDVEGLVQVSGWTDDIGSTSAAHAFHHAVNLDGISGGLPTTLTDLSYVFAGATSLTNIGQWDTSAVTTTAHAFEGTTLFSSNVNWMDVSNVTDMTAMFADATSYNSGLGSWDTSSVRYMDRMFAGATSMSENLSGWDVSQVVSHTDFATGSGLSADQLPRWPATAAAPAPAPAPDDSTAGTLDETTGSPATDDPDAPLPDDDGTTSTGDGGTATDGGSDVPDGTDPDDGSGTADLPGATCPADDQDATGSGTEDTPQDDDPCPTVDVAVEPSRPEDTP